MNGLAICPEPSITMGGCHQGFNGHSYMVMARPLLMFCLGPAQGKVQGREEPPRHWLEMGKSIKSRWWQTPAGG